MKHLRTSRDESSTSTWKTIVRCMTLVSIKPLVDQSFAEQDTGTLSGTPRDAQSHSPHTLFPGVSNPQGQPQPERSQRVALKRGGSSSTQGKSPRKKRMRPSTTCVQDLSHQLNEVIMTTPAPPQGDSRSAPHSLDASESKSDDWLQSRSHKFSITTPPVEHHAFAPPHEVSEFDPGAESVSNLLGYAASGEPCFEDDPFTPTWSVADMDIQDIVLPKDPGRLKEYMINLYHLLPTVTWRRKSRRRKLEFLCRTTTIRKLSVVRRHMREFYSPSFRRCVNTVVQQIDPKIRSFARRLLPDRYSTPSHDETHRSISHTPHNDNEEGRTLQRSDNRAFPDAKKRFISNAPCGSQPRLKNFSRFAARCLIILGGFWTPMVPDISGYGEKAANRFWPAGCHETQCLHEALDLIAQRDHEDTLSTPYRYKVPASYLEAHPCFLLLAMHAPKCTGEPSGPPNVQMIQLLAWIDNLWKVMKYVEAGKRGALPPFPGDEVSRKSSRNCRELLTDEEMDRLVANLEEFYSEHLSTTIGDVMAYKKKILNKFRETCYTKQTRSREPLIGPRSDIDDSVFCAWWHFREQLPSTLSFDTRGFIALLIHYLDKKKGLNEYSRYLGDFLAQVLTWWNHRTLVRPSGIVYQLTSSNIKSQVSLDDRICMAKLFLHQFCEKYGIAEALMESSEQECRTLSDQFLEADIEFFKFLDCNARLSTLIGVRRGILQRCLAYATAIYEKRNALNASKLAGVSEAEVSEAEEAPSGRGSETNLQDLVTPPKSQ